MNYTLEERKAARYKLLEKAYEISNGSDRVFMDLFEIGEKLNFPEDLTNLSGEFLFGEYLIEHISEGSLFRITHDGIREIEEAKSHPDVPTEHFLPINIVNNYLSIGNMSNSNIQQGSSNSTQNITSPLNSDLNSFIELLEKSYESLNIDNDKLDKIKNDVDTIKALLNTRKPNIGFIKNSLASIRNIIEGIAASSIASKLMAHIDSIQLPS